MQTASAIPQVSRYGHRAGSMSAAIDDMLFDGMDIAGMVDKLVKDFGRTHAQALAKVKAHTRWDEKVRGVGLKVDGSMVKSTVANASADLLVYKPFAKVNTATTAAMLAQPSSIKFARVAKTK
jgi:hypothetical protein